MKRLILAAALVAAFPVLAQDSTSSGTALSSSSSNPVVSNGSSTSTSGANVEGVTSVSNPNNSAQQMIQLNTYNPDQVTSSSSATVNSNGTQRNIVEGGTTNRNINEGEATTRVIYSGSQTVKSAPSIQMSGPASGPCTGVSGGVGISGPGWGVGFNGSSVMNDCRMRENTRVLGMAMQSLDGGANPQEKGEVTVIFMDSVRALGQYNQKIANEELGRR